MGLTHTKDTLVGSPLVKGISGGERKRLCVAMELIMSPKLLFLDEPTSGLDSVAALILVTRLKELTDAGKCTVVCTIHQPQVCFFFFSYAFVSFMLFLSYCLLIASSRKSSSNLITCFF